MSSPELYPQRPEPRGWPEWSATVRRAAAESRIRMGALIAVAAVAGFVWYQVGREQAALAPPPERHAAAVPNRAERPAPVRPHRTVLVHVAGAVVRPGLVRLVPGARVNDAVTAAGGPAPNADLNQLNLAAKVVDGQRILVVVLGAPGAATDGATGATAGDPSAAAGDAASGPVNLNTATAAQLDALPGIGPSLATAILRERERRNGFTSVEQLRNVRGIGDKRFADLKPMVTV